MEILFEVGNVCGYYLFNNVKELLIDPDKFLGLDDKTRAKGFNDDKAETTRKEILDFINKVKSAGLYMFNTWPFLINSRIKCLIMVCL
jgi:hypothetical protein